MPHTPSWGAFQTPHAKLFTLLLPDLSPRLALSMNTFFNVFASWQCPTLGQQLWLFLSFTHLFIISQRFAFCLDSEVFIIFITTVGLTTLVLIGCPVRVGKSPLLPQMYGFWSKQPWHGRAVLLSESACVLVFCSASSNPHHASSSPDFEIENWVSGVSLFNFPLAPLSPPDPLVCTSPFTPYPFYGYPLPLAQGLFIPSFSQTWQSQLSFSHSLSPFHAAQLP